MCCSQLVCYQPLFVGSLSVKASLLGTLWGFGHSTGQLILGIAMVVLKVGSGLVCLYCVWRGQQQPCAAGLNTAGIDCCHCLMYGLQNADLALSSIQATVIDHMLPGPQLSSPATLSLCHACPDAH